MEDNPIEKSWGNQIMFLGNDENGTLHHAVVNTLEFILESCLSRINEEGSNEDIEVSTTSTSVKILKHAQSRLEMTTTDILVQK